jgi:shikimate dehydrogenase
MAWSVGVIGSPISHSLSPAMQRAAMAHLGIEGTAEHVECTLENAGEVRGFFPERFQALSVTMPLKIAMLDYLDEIDPQARRIGAINSLLWREGKLWGRNTDGVGFVRAAMAQCDFVPEGARVVILGSGGSARAIIDGLSDAGVSRVDILARNSEAVAGLVGQYALAHPYSQNGDAIDLVINTTPATSRPDVAEILPGISEESIAVDITYQPRESTWLLAHRDAGLRTSNGLGMLAYQAVVQYEWWFGGVVDAATLLEVIS